MKKIKELWLMLGAYRNIVLFILVLFAANFLWKLSISGDESDSQVLLFNSIDVSGLFDFMVIRITETVRALLPIFGVVSHGHFSNDICFANHYSVLIIWGCTAIKQAFIFLCIMLVTPGPWKKKLWYIPLGLVVVHVFNMLRILIIVLVTEHHPEYFYLLHHIVLKYLFYAVVFAVWLFWEEKINCKRNLKTA